ncbi:MAG: prepilin-type N-terminal cleavage/methylation domain-containing protein [Candidatus Electrothrix sp. GM3_4]|nr:prepilin-type N-terminal cleavage/methylation domain-containing protein [Candidatus Electrothrix sp. GM3_4]
MRYEEYSVSRLDVFFITLFSWVIFPVVWKKVFYGMNSALLKERDMLLKDSLSGCLVGKQNERGLSLVELMITLAIFGALSAIAVPGHFATRPRRRLKAATRELYGIMQQARLMAVKEHRSKRVRFGTLPPITFY